MYGETEWRKARKLFDAGVSKSAIARQLGMSRITVAGLLALEAPPRRKGDVRRRGTGPRTWGPPGRQITILPPIFVPPTPEQREPAVRALARLLLAHMERQAGRRRGG